MVLRGLRLSVAALLRITMALRRPRKGMNMVAGTHSKGLGGFQTRPYDNIQRHWPGGANMAGPCRFQEGLR